MEAKEKLFSGVYPTGIVYADKTREAHGDYKKLGYLSFKTLKLELYGKVPKDLKALIEKDAGEIREKRGEEYEISTSGQTITLGWGM